MERVTVARVAPDGRRSTESREEEGWRVVPRGGGEVPGPRGEMLGEQGEQGPPGAPSGDRLYTSIFQRFFGRD